MRVKGLFRRTVVTRGCWRIKKRSSFLKVPRTFVSVSLKNATAQNSVECDPPRWDQVFEAERLNSPDKSRSTSEWKTLRRNISKLSDLGSRSGDGEKLVRAEMPFLWVANDRRCLEGVVDLAVFDPGEKKWFILDWKTNEITLDEIDKLRAHYCSQLAAYWKAVSEMRKHRSRPRFTRRPRGAHPLRSERACAGMVPVRETARRSVR